MTETPAALPPPAETPLPRTSTMAVVSLITGVLAWFLLPLVGAIVAVITGHMAKKEIAQSGGWLIGDGLATAGLVLGYIHFAFVVLGLCLALVLGIAAPLLCVGFWNALDSATRAIGGL